jgi:hypothetical protein
MVLTNNTYKVAASYSLNLNDIFHYEPPSYNYTWAEPFAQWLKINDINPNSVNYLGHYGFEFADETHATLFKLKWF